MARQLRSSTRNKRPRPETGAPETKNQSVIGAPAVTQAVAEAPAAPAAAAAMAIDRSQLTAIRTVSAQSRTRILAMFPEGARLAIFAAFPEFAGAPAAPTTTNLTYLELV